MNTFQLTAALIKAMHQAKPKAGPTAYHDERLLQWRADCRAVASAAGYDYSDFMAAINQQQS